MLNYRLFQNRPDCEACLKKKQPLRHKVAFGYDVKVIFLCMCKKTREK